MQHQDNTISGSTYQMIPRSPHGIIPHRYLRYEELQNVIRNGAVPDREREIISRRKEYRPLVEAYW